MPIQCSLTMRSVETDEFGRLDYPVMKHCFDSQNELGRLAVESVYHHDVAARLLGARYDVAREVEVVVSFGTFSKPFFLDVVVDNWGLYEFKAVAALNREHETQLLNYLRLLDIAHGKVVNFRTKSVESKFVNSDRSRLLRTQFEVEQRGYTGDLGFVTLVISLLRDWGTGLSLALYQDAASHLLGGEVDVPTSVPMVRHGTSLGHQPFLLSAADRAWRLTAFPSPSDDYGRQLQKLIQHSGVRTVDWVNIALDRVTFQTISKA